MTLHDCNHWRRGPRSKRFSKRGSRDKSVLLWRAIKRMVHVVVEVACRIVSRIRDTQDFKEKWSPASSNGRSERE
jgi:hypothetical protein